MTTTDGIAAPNDGTPPLDPGAAPAQPLEQPLGPPPDGPPLGPPPDGPPVPAAAPPPTGSPAPVRAPAPPQPHGRTGHPPHAYGQAHPSPGYPPAGYPPSGQQPYGYQPSSYPAPGYRPPGYPPSGHPSPGYPPSGHPSPGYPPSGQQPYGYQPYGYQPYGYQPYGYRPGEQAHPPQGYGPPGQPPVRRYPPVLPIQGRRPPLWVFLVILVVFLAPGVYAWLRYGPVGDEPIVPIGHLGLIEAGFALGVVVLTVVFRWSRSVGWVPGRRTALPVPLIAMALVATSALLILSAGVSLSWRTSAYVLIVLNFLAVGVFEETMFRGLLWAALPERWSASKVLLVTSVSFGAVHVANGFTTGRWDVAVVQACVVSVAGLGLGALRMRTGWLALGVITHAFLDAGLAAITAVAPSMRDPGPGDPLPASLVVASLLALALLGLYATLGISGIVVLVRTFRSERQLRRLAGWYPGAAGPSPTWPPGPPTLVG